MHANALQLDFFSRRPGTTATPLPPGQIATASKPVETSRMSDEESPNPLKDLRLGDLVQWELPGSSGTYLYGGVVLEIRPNRRDDSDVPIEGTVFVERYPGPRFGHAVKVPFKDVIPVENPDDIYPALSLDHDVVQYAGSLEVNNVFQLQYYDEDAQKWKIAGATVLKNLSESYSLVASIITGESEGVQPVINVSYRFVLPWHLSARDMSLVSPGTWDTILPVWEKERRPVIQKENQKRDLEPQGLGKTEGSEIALAQLKQRKRRTHDDLSIDMEDKMTVGVGKKRAIKPTAKVLELPIPRKVRRRGDK